MRKLLLSVTASCALVAVAPTTALAHHRGHRRSHHHARVHFKTFGSDSSQPGSTTPTSTMSGQSAGTIQSFTGGTLTILLANGQTVSGQVTPDTEIECQSSDTSSSWQGHDHGGDNNNAGNDDNNDQGDDDQGQGDDDNANPACDMSALTPNTVVQEAELKFANGAATWDKLVLASSSSQSSSQSDS
jgi:hypothetical protein